jgi:hypothetical protein
MCFSVVLYCCCLLQFSSADVVLHCHCCLL